MEHSVKITLIAAGIAIVVAIGVMFAIKPNAVASGAAPNTSMNAIPPPPGAAMPSAEMPGQSAGFEVNPNGGAAPGK